MEILECIKCGGEVVNKGEDSISMCSDCGMVNEGIIKKPIFSTKHYKAIAEELSRFFQGETFIGEEYSKLVEFSTALEEMYKKDNPKFNSKRFWRMVYKVKS